MHSPKSGILVTGPSFGGCTDHLWMGLTNLPPNHHKEKQGL